MAARSIWELHLLVVLDRLGGDGHAEIALGLHDRDPEVALRASGDAAVLTRPDGRLMAAEA
jgi:hypothetical protein